MLVNKKPYHHSIRESIVENRPNFITEIETALKWDDLVVSKSTQNKIKEIEEWLKQEKNIEGNSKSEHLALFQGTSGTGKTLTATLLGKYTHYPVFRVNLSKILSNYIGETEKNLSKVFELASQNNGILFFDEADALFGKRTEIKNSHDRFANQEVSYILENLREHKGLVIISSNLRKDIDPQLKKYFKTIIRFRKPTLKRTFKTQSKLAIKKQKINFNNGRST